MDGSILDSPSQEIVGIIAPVSISMLLIILLVSYLNPPLSSINSSSSTQVTTATLVYPESPSDPPLKNLLLSSFTTVTFLLVILYYYNITNFLKAYICFSAFFVLASMSGSILLSLLCNFSLPLNAPSAMVLLLNFFVIGVLSVFSPAIPIVVCQSYLVALAIIVFGRFTKLPEWTTWILLLALVAYNLATMLYPRGPLCTLGFKFSTTDQSLFTYTERWLIQSKPHESKMEERLSGSSWTQRQRGSWLRLPLELRSPFCSSTLLFNYFNNE